MNTKVEMFADDLFLFASFGFVVVCYVIFLLYGTFAPPAALLDDPD